LSMLRGDFLLPRADRQSGQPARDAPSHVETPARCLRYDLPGGGRRIRRLCRGAHYAR
jgi:hypothetical protein